MVTRWQHYIALRDELAALDAAKAKRDEVQLTSLEAQAALQEKQQQIAAAQTAMQEAQGIVTANDQKVKDLTTAVATMEAQKVVQVDVMTKTQTAVPLLKAALVQATAALAALPENAEIKSSTESWAAVTDRQEKSIVGMTEAIAVLDKAMAAAKSEMELSVKTIATATETLQATEKSMQALTAEVPAIEVIVTTTTGELTTAEQAVAAAAAIVEARRQQMRPELQVTSVR